MSNNNNKKKEIRRGTISSKNPNKDEEEPGFKEYAIIFGVIFAIIFGAYFAFEIFDNEESSISSVYEQANITDTGFEYTSSTFNGRVANIQFVYDFENLEEFEFRQDLSNSWFENHNNISIITPDVIRPQLENALLIKSSGKLLSFIRNMYGVSFDENNFQTKGENNTCKSSNKDNALIIFNYNTDELEVNIDEQTPHCVEINVNQSGVDFVKAVDMIMFDTIIRKK